MKEIPILFSQPMMQANRAGTKTMTRRLINPQPIVHNDMFPLPMPVDEYGQLLKKWAKKGYTQIYTRGVLTGHMGPKCRYGEAGDLLWFRENWNYFGSLDPGYLSFQSTYPTDLIAQGVENIPDISKVSFRPSIHMKKEVAQVWARNEGVKAERLQDISEADAMREGVQQGVFRDGPNTEKGEFHLELGGGTYRDGFKFIICKLHGRKVWEQNPFVWAISYRIISTHGRPEL